MPRLTLLSALCSLLSACAAVTPDTSRPVTEDYTFVRGDWPYGSYTVIAARASNVGGFLGVCGGYATVGDELNLEAYEAELLRLTTLSMDGQSLLTGIEFMANFGQDASFRSKEAGCVVSSAPWREGFNGVKIVINTPEYLNIERAND